MNLIRYCLFFGRRRSITKGAKKLVSFSVAFYVYDGETDELIYDATVSVTRSGKTRYYNTADRGYVTFSVTAGEIVEINVSKAGYLADRIILIVTGELNEKYNAKITALDYNSRSPVQNAYVTITGDSESYEGYTDENGEFAVTLNKNVEYTVNITADGYDYGEMFKLVVI